MHRHLNRQQEKLLIAALAGLILVCAAAFAVEPALAGPVIVAPATGLPG